MIVSQGTNVAFAIRDIALEHGHLPAIVAADVMVDYNKYWQITQSFASKMRELGVRQGSFVMVQTLDMVASLASLHATALLGARYSSFDPKIASGEVDAINAPSFVFHTPDAQPKGDFNSICITPEWLRAAHRVEAHDEFEGFSDPEQPWMLVQTSGTTGVPKYLWLTARQVYLRTKASMDDFVLGATRFGTLFPCNSRPFFARANAALMSASAIVDTVDIEFLKRQRVNLFCASPRTSIEWLGGRVIQPKLPLIQVSGARLEPEQLRILLQSFDVVEDVYGASETSKSHVNRIDLVDGKLRVIGRKLDSHVQIIGTDGMAIAEPGKQGLVCVSNPYINCDYVGRPEAAAAVLKAGFFQSGDIATWGRQGELLIHGRMDQLINLGGMKVDPTQVEALMMRANSVMSSVVTVLPRPTTPPRLMALITVADVSKTDHAFEEIRKLCEKNLPGALHPALVFVVDKIPSTIDGVPLRTICANIAAELVKNLETREVP